MKLFKGLLTGLLLLLCSLTNASDISVNAFASLPDVSHVSLSPDGKKIVYLKGVNSEAKKGTAIAMFDLETKKSSYLAYADNKKYVMTSVNWKSNDNLLVEAKFADSRQGTPTVEYRLVQLNVNTKKIKPTLPGKFLERLFFVPNIQSNVVDYLPGDDEHILLSMSGANRFGTPAVIKLNLNGKRVKYPQRGEANIWGWMTDAQHRVRIAIYRKDTKVRIMERKDEDSDFRTLWEYQALSTGEVKPLGFGANPNELYVLALHNGKDAVFKVDLNSENLDQQLIYANEKYDVRGALKVSNTTSEVIGIGRHYWDKDIAKLQKAIDKALPDTRNYITSFSDDMNVYTVLATSDTEPGIYIVGDRKNKSMDVVAYRYNNITPDLMNNKERFTYKARDGLTIEGYKTIPQNSSGEKLPTVIFPHGGPISYDNDSFDYWTQFFASQGYAVIQMNFRGSDGYGSDFMQMGLQNWGQAMQDDVADAAHWAIEKGIADPERICIVGASYGGYAALMGSIKTPDLYQCAVSFGGVTDLEYLVRKSKHYVGQAIVEKMVGDDSDLLEENSPVEHAEKIKIPVLLIHGEKDRVVRVAHSEKMYSELKSNDADVEYLELPKGDHYLSNGENRLRAFQTVASFLDKHL